MTITLPPGIETRLRAEAQRRGADVEDYARQLIATSLATSPPIPDQATIDLLNEWESEDFTEDPEELARRQQEFDEFKAAMNRNRLEMEGPNARTPFP